MRNRAANALAQRLLLQAVTQPESLTELSLPEWDLLLRVARRMRLLGHLQCRLSALGLLSNIPTRVVDHLQAAAQVIDYRQTLVRWEVNRLNWALKDLDATMILLKGAAYLMAGLPPTHGRLFADVDLLVPEDSLHEVERHLLEKGWFRTQLDPYDDRYYREWMHEIPPLRHRERGTEIDIHHRIIPRTSHYLSDPTPLLEDFRPLPGTCFRMLAPADMVLHSAAHLFLDGDPDEGMRLRDLLDFDALLRHFSTDPGFWENLIARARQLGFGRLLYYGVYFSGRLLNSEVPSQIRAEIDEFAPNLAIRSLMETLATASLLPEHPDFPSRRIAVARWLTYVRAHWLRMPPNLLCRHLAVKAWLRFRGIRKRVDLAQLDLRQQQ